MTDALVGWSGFVGGNLLAQHSFDARYRSSDIDRIAGEEFDLVVFSAAKAEKWRINQNPDDDERHIADLERTLASFSTRKLVLVSTVDVYGTPVGVDETDDPDETDLHPYGLHRLRLERTARELHDDVLVVRLPGLFGPGLKKNVVYDLLHDNNVDRIHRDGRFQYYDLRALWADLTTAIDAGLELVNLVTEPVSTREVAQRAFGIDFENIPEGVGPGLYDVRTVHAEAFGGRDGYIADAEVVLDRLADFVRTERAPR